MFIEFKNAVRVPSCELLSTLMIILLYCGKYFLSPKLQFLTTLAILSASFKDGIPMTISLLWTTCVPSIFEKEADFVKCVVKSLACVSRMHPLFSWSIIFFYPLFESDSFI